MAERTAEFRHGSSLTWNARDAPLHNGGNRGSALLWRERAALHREAMGLHKCIEAEIDSCGHEPAALQDIATALEPAEYGVGHEAVMLTDDISAADLVVTDNLVVAPDGDSDIDEGYSDDWWGLAMRLDFERYVAYKNAQFRIASQDDVSVAQIFENAAVWKIITEIVSWERSTLRRHARGQVWPETLLSPAVMSRNQVEALKCHVKSWTQALEDINDIGSTRTTLQHLPVDFALQQLLCDALSAAGEMHEARWGLLLVVGAASPEKEPEERVGQGQFAPPRIGWDDRCKCDLVKAQQCMRFGRLAVVSAQALSSKPTSQEYTAGMSRLRADQNRTALSQEVASGQRHLTDARKLYKAELLALEKLGEAQSSGHSGSCMFGAREMSSLRMVLRCGYLGATGLLAAIYSLGGRAALALDTYEEAIREASILLGDASEAPRLQRLLTAEREKMLHDRSQLLNIAEP